MRAFLPHLLFLLRSASLPLVWLASSCVVDTTVPPDALLACTDDDASCPAGRTCVDGRCLTPEQLALPAPAFETAPSLLTANAPADVVSPNAGRDTFAVEFVLNIDVVPGQGAQDVSAALDDVALACVEGDAARSWSCSGAVDDATAEGAFPIVVTVSDALGRKISDSVTILVDTTPPAGTVVDAFISASALRATPTAARTGAEVTLLLRLDADVDPESVVVVGAPPEAEEYVFDAATNTATLASVDDALPDGPREVRISATDLAGNELTSSAPNAYLVDTSTPSAPDVNTAGAVVYERAPWGRAIEGAAPSSVIIGAAGSVESDALVVVSADAAGTQALGVIEAGGDGAFTGSLTIGDLSSLFVRAVDGAGNESAPLRVRDGVWTATAAQPLGAPASPIDVALTSRFGAALFDDAHVDVDAADASDALAAANDDDDAQGALRARTRAAWRERTFRAGPVVARAALAGDIARAEVVLFGGVDEGGAAAALAPVGDTWTFDGEQWRERAPSRRPPARHGAAMAYDVDADLTVLFGGTGEGGTLLDDTWVWDGADWTLVDAIDAPDAPSARTGAGLASLASTAPGLLLFGGETTGGVDDETWRFDALALTWTLIDVAATGDVPPARADFAITSDAIRGGVILFGGATDGAPLDDVWLFAEDSWSELSIGAGVGAPEAQAGATLFFDVARGVPVFVGTDAAGVAAVARAIDDDDTWSALGTNVEPSTRSFAAAASLLDRSVVVGGVGPGNVLRDDTLVLRAQFSALSALAPITPPALTSASGAYDAPNDRGVVAGISGGRRAFGFDRLAWASLASDNGASGALSVNLAQNVVLVDAFGVVERLQSNGFVLIVPDQGVAFGGSVAAAFDGVRVVAAGTDIASLAGTTWTSDAEPGVRVETALSAAGDAETGEGAVLMFGGSGCAGAPGGICDDTWLFVGNAWTEVNVAANDGPSPRSAHAMAFDGGRREVILFGGIDENGASAETWAFTIDGGGGAPSGAWRLVAVDGAPPARNNHAMTALEPIAAAGADDEQPPAGAARSDDAKAAVVLFGGVVGIANDDDTWQLDGGGDDVAGALVRVRFAAAGVPDAIVDDVTVRARAGATGHPAGAAANGVALSSWTRAGWSVIASAIGGVSAPGLIEQSLANGALNGGALFVGADRTLHFALAPTAESGAFVDDDELVVDAFEISVRYRLP